MGDDEAIDFIKRRSVCDALETITGAHNVTIIVGAGPSAEIGFPTWAELVRRVLARAADRCDLERQLFDRPAEAADAVARDLIARYGVVAAATMAQAKLGDNFLNTVRSELYDGVPANVAPGTLHTEIARLLTTFPPRDRELATTNYDVVQETAVSRFGMIPVSVVGAEPAGDAETYVRHLHGVLTQDHVEHVVITEADYAHLQAASSWQEKFLCDRLASSNCLFVGMSMTDPNIIRLLHKTAASPKARHVALFARMVSRSLTSPEVEAQRAREALGTARWQQVGVRPVMTDYLMQVPEFLYEASGQRLGADHISYPARLEEWESAISKRWHRLQARKGFLEAQAELHGVLRDALEQFERQLADAVVDRRDESFSLRLFSRIPSRHQLIALASSEMEWRDPAAVDRETIALPARHVAVEAFCQGATVVAALDEASGPRWRTVRAVPIILPDGRYGRLPVGVMTVASTAHTRKSILPRLSSVAPVAEQALVSLGCHLLGLSEGSSRAST